MVSGRGVAGVPLPAPRPVELYDEDDEPDSDAGSGETRVAPLLIPPPPPSGSAVGRPVAAPRAPAVEVVAGEDLPAQCASLVEQQAMMAVRVAPIDGKGACGLSVAVKLSAIRLQDGSLVPLKPAAVLACETAASVTNWVREDIAPAVAGLGTHMEAIKVAASYDCRTRNRIRGAQISEHGRGNAMDVGGFVLAGGQVVEVKSNGLPLPLQVAMKSSACERFGTVLGPGSDGYHEDHVHVDVAKRRLDVKLCRWTIKGPAPVKEPLVAGPAAGDPAPAQEGGAQKGEEQEGEAQEAVSKEIAEAGVPLPTRRPALPTDKPGRARGG